MRDKTESTSQNSEQAQPFFARFLEGQESAKNSLGTTLKYPSDADEVVWVSEYASDSNAR